MFQDTIYQCVVGVPRRIEIQLLMMEDSYWFHLVIDFSIIWGHRGRDRMVVGFTTNCNRCL
jgi:hypothetical protein